MAETNSDEFKEDCRFMADWLKTKGLHKLSSVFEGTKNYFILSVNDPGFPFINRRQGHKYILHCSLGFCSSFSRP